MKEEALAAALEDCKASAEEGYRIASEVAGVIHELLEQAEENLEEAEASQEDLDRLERTGLLSQQRQEIIDLQRMDCDIKQNVDRLWRQKKDFSIVVYGRTMAGKSTLMEILTHGNGESIGKGAQRTTRDVRDYYWKGMKVTDVPGICSFDGREDDALAMEAAKKADLIVFLLTDDAPQEEEAQQLATLRDEGKSVLGIVNVKLGLNLARRAMAVRDLTRKMQDTERIDTIRSQFCEFGRKFGQDWSKIPFVYAHLQAAYLGREDEELFSLSNFAQVEDVLLDKVTKEASLLRTKNFLENVRTPLLDAIDALFDASGRMIRESDLLEENGNKLLAWKDDFDQFAQDRLEAFMTSLREEADGAIQEFSEIVTENDDSDEVKEKFFDCLGEVQIDRKSRSFLKSLEKNCNRKLRSLADDTIADLEFHSFEMKGLKDHLDFNIETSFQNAFRVAGAALFFVNPLAGLLATVFSFLSDSRAEKMAQARAELRDKAHGIVDPYLKKLRKSLANNIEEGLMQGRIWGFYHTLFERQMLLLDVANQQNELAQLLDTKFDDLSHILLTKTMEFALQRSDIALKADYVRVPGRKMIAIGKIPFLSTEDQERVERVLGESLEIVPFDEANGDDFSEKIHQIMQEILGKTKHELMTYTYPAPNSEDEEEKKEIRFLQVEPKAERRKNWDSMRSMLQQAAFAPVVLMRISD
ncbi:GTPase [Selenomonas sp.]|uniref:GTPase n=1 Tax=Selenomonas sp. TaxID=2053611 RepID=UPI002A75B931|nr:GTPase [Selenomonas sp.]MDY3296383.1 GTPase [Selenomonas sp.]